MDIATTMKTASESVKFLRGMFDGYVDGLSKEKVAELQQKSNQKVLDIQQALLDLQGQAFELQAENQRLKDELRKHTEIHERLASYSLQSTEGGAYVYASKDEPRHYICPTCVESNSEVHYLQYNNNAGMQFECKNCESKYKIGKTKPMALPNVQTRRRW